LELWNQVWCYYLNFHAHVCFPLTKTSSATLTKLRIPITWLFFYWNISLFNPIYLIKVLIKPFAFCINTFVCLKINKYSSGLFVSYSREKPNCTKQATILKHNSHNMATGHFSFRQPQKNIILFIWHYLSFAIRGPLTLLWKVVVRSFPLTNYKLMKITYYHTITNYGTKPTWHLLLPYQWLCYKPHQSLAHLFCVLKEFSILCGGWY